MYVYMYMYVNLSLSLSLSRSLLLAYARVCVHADVVVMNASRRDLARSVHARMCVCV